MRMVTVGVMEHHKREVQQFIRMERGNRQEVWCEMTPVWQEKGLWTVSVRDSGWDSGSAANVDAHIPARQCIQRAYVQITT